MAVPVAVGVKVLVGVYVTVAVAVFVGVLDGVGENAEVGVLVRVLVGVKVAVGVYVLVGVLEAVAVAVFVAVDVPIPPGTRVAVISISTRIVREVDDSMVIGSSGINGIIGAKRVDTETCNLSPVCGCTAMKSIPSHDAKAVVSGPVSYVISISESWNSLRKATCWAAERIPAQSW